MNKFSIGEIEFKKQLLIVFIILSFLTLLIYYDSFFYGRSNYDDHVYFEYLEDLLKNGFSISAFYSICTDFVNSNWHPLTVFSLSLDFIVGNGNPVTFHITNSVLHIFNGLFVYLIFYKLSNNSTASIFTAVLFIIHPLNVESVIWISERKGLLSAFFALLSIYYYIEHVKINSVGFKYLSLLFYALSLLAKPTTAPVLIILIFLDLTVFMEHNANLIRMLLVSIKSKVAYFVALTIIIYFSFMAQSDTGALRDLSQVSFLSRFETGVNNIFVYISKIFLPINLAAYYPHPDKPMPLIVLYLGLIVLWVYLVIRFFHKSTLIVFCLIFFFIQLIPLSGVFQTGSHSIALRYTYLPAIGLFFIVSLLLSKIKNKILNFSIMISIAIILMITSVNQSKVWASPLALWRSTIDNTDKNYYSAYYYCQLLIQKGEVLEAANHFYDLIGIKNTYYANSAIPWITSELIERKYYTEAKIIIDKAILNNIKSPEIITELVLLDYFYFNKKKRAKLNIKAVIDADPNNLKANRLYARILMVENNESEALRILNNIKSIYPDDKLIIKDIGRVLEHK